jgi:hypothetical protein
MSMPMPMTSLFTHFGWTNRSRGKAAPPQPLYHGILPGGSCSPSLFTSLPPSSPPSSSSPLPPPPPGMGGAQFLGDNDGDVVDRRDAGKMEHG